MSVHKIASNHYKNRPKTNLEQIITPILGPDKTVTPERANLDQQENMIRKGRKEERTKIKQGRKSITAENPKPTKHYKNSGLRQLSRTPRLEHRKQSIFEKAVTKIGFWGQDRIHYVYSGFVRFCPTTTNRKSMVGKGGPGKRPVVFLGRAKVIRTPFRRRPNFEPRTAFSEGSLSKNPILSRNSRKGSKIEDKTENDDTMRLVRTPLFPRFFLWKKLRVRKGSEPQKRYLGKRGLITGPCKGATKHYENQYFWTMKTPGPIFERIAGPIIEPMNRKIRPHYRNLQHAYIYIYAGGCDVRPPFEQNQCTIKGPQTCTDQRSVQSAVGGPRWSSKQPTQNRGRRGEQTKGRTPRWGQEIKQVWSLFLATPYLQKAVDLKLPDRPAARGTKKPHSTTHHRIHNILIWTFLGHSLDILERQKMQHLPFKRIKILWAY